MQICLNRYSIFSFDDKITGFRRSLKASSFRYIYIMITSMFMKWKQIQIMTNGHVVIVNV